MNYSHVSLITNETNKKYFIQNTSKRKLKLMNTVSIVIDSEVLSKWKFDLISRICKVIDVKEFIILGKKSKTTFKGILLTFLTQNLSSLSLVGKFSSLPRVHDSDLFRA